MGLKIPTNSPQGKSLFYGFDIVISTRWFYHLGCFYFYQMEGQTEGQTGHDFLF